MDRCVELGARTQKATGWEICRSATENRRVWSLDTHRHALCYKHAPITFVLGWHTLTPTASGIERNGPDKQRADCGELARMKVIQQGTVKLDSAGRVRNANERGRSYKNAPQ